MKTQSELITRFMLFKRIAVVGVSHNPNEFSRKLWLEFRTRGVDAVPVHRERTEIDCVPCYPNMQAIDPPVQGALLLVPKNSLRSVLEDCVAAKIRTVWLYGIRGEKDVAAGIVAFCREHDLDAITGHCPYMFLHETPFFHKLHGFVWKMIGYYPK